MTILLITATIIIIAFFMYRKSKLLPNQNIQTNNSSNVNIPIKRKKHISASQRINYPDRTDDIMRLQKIVNLMMLEGNLELANLNFAKLIEAMRQQNINLDYELTDVLEDTKKLYSQFREENNIQYPLEFSQNNEEESENNSSDSYSELLKSATQICNSDIDGAIELINKALDIDSTEFQTHKKLCSYLQKANRFIEAEKHLWQYYSESSEFAKSEALDYLAVLHKKEKNDKKAIELDSYGVYYKTMFNSPLAYFSIDPYYDSISLNRSYKNKELEELLNSTLKEFWGKEWLTKYLNDYKLIFKESRKQKKPDDFVFYSPFLVPLNSLS